MADNFLRTDRRYGIGNQGYPTGRTPFAMDLATPTYALTQRMVKQKQLELQGKKDEISQNVKSVLEGLDFEAVKGLGTEINQKHMQMLQEVEDKWSEKLQEKGGFLSSADRMELKADKDRVEQTNATLRSQVAAFASAQEQFIRDLNSPRGQMGMGVYDMEETTKNFANFKNFVGDPKKDPWQILVPRAKGVPEVVGYEFGELIDDIAKKYETRIKSATATSTLYKKSNEQILEELAGNVVSSIERNPRFNKLAQRYGMEGVRQGVKDYIKNRHVSLFEEKRHSDYSGARRGDAEYDNNMYHMNVFLHGLMKKNPDTMEDLKTKLGGTDVHYDDKANEIVVSKINAKGEKYPWRKIGLLPEDASLDQKRQWMVTNYKLFGLSEGKIPRDFSQDLEPDENRIIDMPKMSKPESYSRKQVETVAGLNDERWDEREDQKDIVQAVKSRLEFLLPEKYEVEVDTEKSRRRVKVKDKDTGKTTIYKLDKDKGKNRWIAKSYKGRKDLVELMDKAEEESKSSGQKTVDDPLGIL